MSQQQDLVAQSQSRVNELEAKSKKDKDQVATYIEQITNLIKQVEELHQKKATIKKF